jgi:hypothetical protein
MEHRNHDVTYFNVKQPRMLQGTFDVVIMNYCVLSLRTLKKPQFATIKQQLSWILECKCPIVMIAQDEGCCHGLLEDWIIDWGVDVVFSTIWEPDGPLYRRAGKDRKIVKCLTGYIDPTTVQPRLAHNERCFDIVYRARRLPLFYGSMGRLKYEIGDRVKTSGADLRLDIETNLSRGLLGESWLDFLASSRCTLGAECGYTTVDYYGEVHNSAKRHIQQNPAITISELRQLMPTGWDDHWLYTVAPRHLEAATTKTAQILLRGKYEGIFQDGRNCLMVNHDYSNLGAVLDIVRGDPNHVEAIAEQAYQDIVISEKYTYEAFARQIETTLRKGKE